MKLYKFKNVKYSVLMDLILMDKDGNCTLENVSYKGLIYHAHISDLEEVKKGGTNDF